MVETVLKPEWIEEKLEDYQLNYLVDIFTKWSRNRFYFYSKYRCPDPRAISPSFEMGFARMAHIGDGKFNLAYFRHTGKWNEIYEGLTAEEYLKEIENSGFFHP
ncbi:MAG: hypothetical protein ACR2MD_13800 [Aridibacter sp.]